MDGDTKLEIRPATAEDIPAIGTALGRNHGYFYLRRLTGPGVVLTAWREGEPVAAIYASWAPADEPEIRLHLPGVPLLQRLQVRESWRNRRIGSALISTGELLLHGRGHSAVAVGVDPANVRAIALYHRLGYRDWQHGVVATTHEEYGPDGAVTRFGDRCRVFVKSIG